MNYKRETSYFLTTVDNKYTIEKDYISGSYCIRDNTAGEYITDEPYMRRWFAKLKWAKDFVESLYKKGGK